MSAKNNDRQGRFRSLTIAFRVSPEENELLNRKVSASGMNKQDYLISRVLERDVVVTGNPRAIKGLRNQMEQLMDELVRLRDALEIPEDSLELLEFINEIIMNLKN